VTTLAEVCPVDNRELLRCEGGAPPPKETKRDLHTGRGFQPRLSRWRQVAAVHSTTLHPPYPVPSCPITSMADA
jgi:hypothetical protein